MARRSATPSSPVFYLEIPPFLFGTVIKGLAEAGLTKTARVVVEKPFGHDLASARELADEIHQYIDESQLYRIDHFLGKMGLVEILYLRFANAMFEPIWNRNYVASRADHDGGELRGRGPRPLLRPGRRAAGRRRQPPDAGGGGGRDGAAGRPRRRRPSRTRMFAVFRAMPTADPAHYVRGQYEGYRDDRRAWPRTRRTETYAALRARDRQLALVRRARSSSAPGKRLPVTQTELRLVFQHPPRLGFHREGARAPEPDQLVVKLDPTTGIRLLVDAQRARRAEPEQINLDMEFAEEGGEGPTPYEVLLHAAMVGDSTRFTRQDSIEETWRIMQPLLDNAAAGPRLREGIVGPGGRRQAVAGYGRWHEPWVPS